MIRSLIQTGNSKALILTKDMRDHLGLGEEVGIEFRRSAIILRHPDASPEDDEHMRSKAKVKESKEAKEAKTPKAAKALKEPKVAKAEKPAKASKPEKAREKPKDKPKAKKVK